MASPLLNAYPQFDMTWSQYHSHNNPSNLAVSKIRELPQLFCYTDLQKFIGNANVFLTRAHNNGLVVRIAKGVYVNSFLKGFPPVDEAACFLRTPSYISCEWALNHHGILLQAPTVCTTLTLSTAVGKSRNLLYQGVTVEFAHIADRLFSGFETKEGFNMALPEKALLDAIYTSEECSLPR
jgi:predicted transcriptional regulator of viral defense system